MHKAIISILAVFSLAALLFGCASANNERTLGELLDHLTSKGLKITDVTLLTPEAAHAESGIAARIEGRQIGLYRFDLNKKKQKEHLDRAKEKGFIGIAGRKFGADDFAVNGSFVLVDYKMNPKGEEILKAFNSF